MPRLNVIILDKPDNNNPNLWRYALWADVPTARQGQYALLWGASKVSAWADATGTDNQNLQNGSMVEKVDTQQVPGGATLAQIEGFLQQRWVDYQAFVTSNNPWIRYGSYGVFNGATWTWTPGGLT